MLGHIEVVCSLHVTSQDASIHSLRRLRCLTEQCTTLRRLRTPLMADLRPLLVGTGCNTTIVEIDVGALTVAEGALPPLVPVTNALVPAGVNGPRRAGTDNAAASPAPAVSGPAPSPSLNTIIAVPKDVPMPRLRFFKASGTASLKNIDGLNSTNTPLLSKLIVGGTSVAALPSGASLPIDLSFVDLSRCEKLRSIAPLASLLHLTRLDISHTVHVEHVPSMPRLDTLNALNAAGLKSLEPLPSLVRLNLTRCKRIRSLPKLASIEVLHAAHATNLHDLRALGNSTTLTDLNLAHNDALTSLPRLPCLKRLVLSHAFGLVDWVEALGACADTLEDLQLCECEGLVSLPRQGMRSLRHLNVSGIRSLLDVACLDGSTTLESLDLTRCESIRPKLPFLPALRRLIAPSSGLRDIGTLAQSPLLVELNIAGTFRIASLPRMPRLEVLCAVQSDLVDVSALQGCAVREMILPKKAAVFLSRLPRKKFPKLKLATNEDGVPIVFQQSARE